MSVWLLLWDARAIRWGCHSVLSTMEPRRIEQGLVHSGSHPPHSSLHHIPSVSHSLRPLSFYSLPSPSPLLGSPLPGIIAKNWGFPPIWCNFFFPTPLCGLCDPSSSTRDWTCANINESTVVVTFGPPGNSLMHLHSCQRLLSKSQVCGNPSTTALTFKNRVQTPGFKPKISSDSDRVLFASAASSGSGPHLCIFSAAGYFYFPAFIHMFLQSGKAILAPWVPDPPILHPARLHLAIIF